MRRKRSIFIPSAFAVSHLIVDENGIRFARRFGSPKQLPWSSISRVEPVTRSELIWRGWLWPFFPYRENSKSLTSLGHYGIRYGDETVYFPPDDPSGFLEAIERHTSPKVSQE